MATSNSKETMEERLRKMRGYLAYKNGVKPFVVFKDSDIPALLERKPRKVEDLALIKGFPLEGARVEKYGKDICSVFDTKYKIPEMNSF
jgi:superfamily II DNA helicase RecQ